MVHPDIYDAGTTWNGHRYWMAVTPYTDTTAAVEKVCILVSDDKITWTVPAGLTNPVTPETRSDPDIVVTGGTMWMIYRNFTDAICMRSSTDGVTWSDEAVVITGTTTTSLLSPAVIYYGGEWVMFTVKYDSGTPTNSILEKRTCATINGTWSEPTTCTVNNLPAGKYLWHQDVIVDGTTLWAALNLSASYLYLASSVDGGATWTVEASPIITPSGLWDTNIYRATILRTLLGFDIWYSANNNGSPKEWFLGYIVVAHA